MKRLTVLTQPVFPGFGLRFGLHTEYPIKLAQRFVRRLAGRPEPRFTGHPAVTRSLVEGLGKIGADFNYNPERLEEVGDVVHVPGGNLALQQAIRLRRVGRIRRLLAGPNQVVLPSDRPDLLVVPEVDVCVVPSDWIRRIYADDSPGLAERIRVWAAGVDTAFWEAAKEQGCEGRLLFYVKPPLQPAIEPCRRLAEQAGYEVEVVQYGSYDQHGYRRALARSRCLVHFGAQESQGLSLAEAWASDRPTLVLRADVYRSKGVPYPCSSAPYLTQATGRFFVDVAEFKWLLADLAALRTCSPRAWVLENLSDEVCARRLLALAEG